MTTYDELKKISKVLKDLAEEYPHLDFPISRQDYDREGWPEGRPHHVWVSLPELAEGVDYLTNYF